MNKEIILQEIESLIRTLSFIQEEQTFIKRKLSIFLDKVIAADILNWAETLHQEILNRDTAIQLLKNDILKIQNLVSRKKFINNILDRHIVDPFKKFQQQVIYIETEFVTWKNITNEQFESSL